MSTISATCYERKAFVSNLDLDGNNQVDAKEEAIADKIFDQIAGHGRDAFTAEDYKNFAKNTARLTATSELTKGFCKKPPSASAIVARAAKFELERLCAADPNHKLSARVKVLDELFSTIALDSSPKDKSDDASRLWASMPALYLSNFKESSGRLARHLECFPDDCRARALLDEAICSNAQDLIEDLLKNPKGPTVTISVLGETHRVPRARVAEGKQAAQEWLDALKNLEKVSAAPGMTALSGLAQLREERAEMEAYLGAFSSL